LKNLCNIKLAKRIIEKALEDPEAWKALKKWAGVSK